MLSLCGFDSRTWKKWQAMAEQCQRLLTEQPITPTGPGSILKDVDSFLEFVGTEGIATKSRSSTLPIGRLMELNQKSSYPIELTLKRALLREYDFCYRDQRGSSRIYNHPQGRRTVHVRDYCGRDRTAAQRRDALHIRLRRQLAIQGSPRSCGGRPLQV